MEFEEMMSSLKSELRKFLTVRSTYILIASAFALIALFSYFGTSASTYEEAVCAETGEVYYSLDYTDERLYEEGATPEELCGGKVNFNTITINELSKDKLLFNMQEAIPVIAMFTAIVVVLMMAHEFRYNTINYTFTTSDSRSKVLTSKVVISVLLTILVTLLAIGLVVLVTQIAINTKGLVLPEQNYDWIYVVMRHISYMLGYVLLFLGIATLVRNLVASVVAILIVPIVDALIGALLSLRDIEATKVLPFSALDRFGSVAADITNNNEAIEFMTETTSGPASAMTAGLVVAGWVVGLWLLAWILFLRRDAS
jgi:ABC-type transport system involved in multi-copper enzyme maturation permease subunit